MSSSLPEMIPLTPLYNVALLLPSDSRKYTLFALGKLIIGLFQRANSSGLLAISHTSLGPTPPDHPPPLPVVKTFGRLGLILQGLRVYSPPNPLSRAITGPARKMMVSRGITGNLTMDGAGEEEGVSWGFSSAFLLPLSSRTSYRILGVQKRVYQSIANTRANALLIACMVISESFPHC